MKTFKGTETYMAPEIWAEQPYEGTAVDIFALGVILFMLYSRNYPFKCADPKKSQIYLTFLDNNDLFWQKHSVNKEPNFYSSEFKDLINSMLHIDPKQRIRLADIVGHPWLVSGPIATKAEVVAEFSERLIAVEQRRQ